MGSTDFSNLDSPLRYGSFLLYQTGRRVLGPKECVPEHTHRDFLEITLVRSGEATVTTNGKSVRVLPGDIYVSFGGDFHAIEAEGKKPFLYDYLAFCVTDRSLTTEKEWLVSTFGDAQERIVREERMPRDRLPRNKLTTRKNAPTMAVTLDASPSIPSVKLAQFVIPRRIRIEMG